MSDQDPDLTRFEEGHEVRVFYRSTRSGNEVDREGAVSEVVDTGESLIVRVHTGEPEPFKHQFVSLIEAETKAGEEGVFAFSQTVKPAELAFEDAPTIGRTYAIRFEISRSSVLGRVDRVVRTDSSAGPIMMTDGGYTFGGPRPTAVEECPRCERDVSRWVNGNRCPYCHAETFEDDGRVLGEEADPEDTGVEIV